jgi:hypothetical protein
MERSLCIAAFILLMVGCSTPKITLQAEAAFSQQAVRQSGEKVGSYGDFDDLVNFYLSLPAPAPTIINVPDIITPAPGAPDPYAPLLALVQAGPQGHLATRQHLVQLTPAALALAQLYLSGTVSTTQLINSPQAWALLSAAQSIFQPILQQQGLWNQLFLAQWAYYLRPYLRPGPQQQQLINIATTLYNNIVAPPPPGQPTSTPQDPIIITVNPVQIIQTFTELWKTRDWLEIGSKFSDLLYPLIKPSGYTKPMLLLYGSRRRYYGPSAQTMKNDDGDLVVHNMNREGYYKNETATGAGRFFQGQDDISLSYYPIEIENRRVKTLDVVASDRFALLKRMAGGNVDLLSRAYTHNTSLLSVNAGFDNKHLRVVGGVTPYASMGGVMGEIAYDYEYLSGRIGGGGLFETDHYGNSDTFIGFLDTEHTLTTTPQAIVVSEDEERLIFTWASLTMSASGMADRAITKKTKDRPMSGGWGFQGDVRLIPEVHTQLDTSFFSVYAYGGAMVAVVPVGKVNLEETEKSVMLDHIRNHLGVKVRVLVSDIVNSGEDEKFKHTMYADAAVVAEFSDLVRRIRFTTDFTLDLAKIGFIGEAEDYGADGLKDVRLGGRASFMGAYIQGLKSLEFDDFQLQAGFEIKL